MNIILEPQGENLRALFSKILTDHPDQERHFARWAATRGEYYSLHSAIPWIPFDAVDVIAQSLPSPFTFFEFGSGASTLFWLRLGGSGISVEHDKSWHKNVNQHLPDGAPVEYLLAEPEPSTPPAPGDESDPTKYRTSDQHWIHHSFRNYVSTIDRVADGSLDLVVVDGRARASCIMHAASKVKPWGYLLVDNSDRDYYFSQTEKYLTGFKKYEIIGVGPFLDAAWKSTIFERQA